MESIFTRVDTYKDYRFKWEGFFINIIRLHIPRVVSLLISFSGICNKWQFLVVQDLILVDDYGCFIYVDMELIDYSH